MGKMSWINTRWRPATDEGARWPGGLVPLLLDALALEGDSVVVELGAGDGRLTIPIAERLEAAGGAGIVFALEHSERLLDRLERRVGEHGLEARVRAVPLDRVRPGALPLRDHSVSHVLSVNVLQYVDYPNSLVGEIGRVLRPGGSLVVADWHDSRWRAAATAGRRPAVSLQADLVAAGLSPALLVEREDAYWVTRARKVPDPGIAA